MYIEQSLGLGITQLPVMTSMWKTLTSLHHF